MPLRCRVLGWLETGSPAPQPTGAFQGGRLPPKAPNADGLALGLAGANLHAQVGEFFGVQSCVSDE